MAAMGVGLGWGCSLCPRLEQGQSLLTWSKGGREAEAGGRGKQMLGEKEESGKQRLGGGARGGPEMEGERRRGAESKGDRTADASRPQTS